MRVRTTTAVVSTAHFLLAPGLIAGLIPWWITDWRAGSLWLPLRVVGALLLVAAVAAVVHAFVRFAMEGAGTPAPVAPPEHLVVGGLYRYVRHPMYVATLAAIVGQALVLGRPVLLSYAAVVFIGLVAGARWVEEPGLVRRFGEQYTAYRRAVPAWIPRLRPYRPD